MFNKLIKKLKTLWNRFFSTRQIELIQSLKREISIQSDASAPSTSEQEHSRQTQSTPDNKKFEIHEEKNTNPGISAPNQSSGKKFEIAEDQSTNSRFKSHAVTRPKKCPLCRTPDRITRLPSGEWKCKECEHRWGQ